MSKFTVSKEAFSEFLKLCELAGSVQNKELALAVSPTEISACVVSPSSKDATMSIRAKMTGKFEDWGEIGIDSLPPLKAFMAASSTSPTVSLSKTTNKLNCEFNKTKFGATLRDPKYIVNKLDNQEKFSKIATDALKGPSVVLKPEQLKSIFEYVKVVAAKSISISGAKGEITFQFAGTKEECSMDFDGVVEAPFTIKFGEVLLSVLEVLKDYECIMYFEPTLKVAYIKVNHKDLKFEYILRGIL